MGAGGAHQGVEAWNPGISVIFGEELPVYEHLQVCIILFKTNLNVGGNRSSREQCEGESKVESAHVVRAEVKQGDLPGGRRNADCFAARSGPTCSPKER